MQVFGCLVALQFVNRKERKSEQNQLMRLSGWEKQFEQFNITFSKFDKNLLGKQMSKFY